MPLQSGIVAGIDVGYSPARRTTCFCRLDWTPREVRLTFRTTTTDAGQREMAIRDLFGRAPILAVAIDGPLTRGLNLVRHYRSAEALLSRGPFQKRGKPGQTSSPVGQKLHAHATALAEMVIALGDVGESSHPEPIHSKCVVEAFPNLFLGVLINEADLPLLARNASDLYWEATVDRSRRLSGLIDHFLPGRSLEGDLRSIRDHEHRAGVVCALTALAVACGDFVSVGDPEDGDIILPPHQVWGAGLLGNTAWAAAALAANVASLAAEPRLRGGRVRRHESLRDGI